MGRRTAASHAGFLLGALRPGMRLLDCGCGPGTITEGLAAAVAPAQVVGVDREPGQVALAGARGIRGASFVAADATALPFEDGAFDAVHAHALLEHLPRRAEAVAEMQRVLAPGGVVGVASPDWGGFLLAPPDDAAQAALEAYQRLMRDHGADPLVGRRLGSLLAEAGLHRVSVTARYECYEDAAHISGYLAARLEEAGETAAADGLREWGRRPSALFAQAWVGALGYA
jgi:ubiquinone/menaquinone biosynthesis C-methylase UbiE